MRSARAPEWADLLVDLVMVHEGLTASPEITWTNDPLPEGVAFTSAGVTCGDRIIIDLGRSDRDARHTLLHEMAHWVTRNGHTDVMYAKLYELLWLFGQPGDLDYAREREAEYRPIPSGTGWDRFTGRLHNLASHVDEYIERLSVMLPVLLSAVLFA